jgi:hypothetical protein
VLSNTGPNSDQLKNGMEISAEAKADIFARFGAASSSPTKQ